MRVRRTEHSGHHSSAASTVRDPSPTGDRRDTAPTQCLRTVTDVDTPLDRRKFLQIGGGAAAVAMSGGLLAACGSDSKAASETTAAGSGSSKPAGDPIKLTLGFIALTDCSPLVIAKEKGFYEERGLDVTLVKQASWPATRDNLLSGQIDGAHCLNWMPYSVATGIGGNGTTDLKVAMMLNNNGQAITLGKDLAEAGYADLDKARSVLDAEPRTLAMTFPGGTHDLWIRYWLRATGADESKAKINPIPPPQMVANMKVNNMDAFCVGEPWNAVAVQQGIGFTHITTQDIWLHHPEKALVVNAKTAANDEALQRLILGTLDACKWLDDLDNRSDAAEIVGKAEYINAPAAEIRGRLLGKYDLGADLGSKDFKGHQMMFFRDGETNAPLKSYGIWGLCQYQRLGLLKSTPDYKALTEAIVLTDAYAKAAKTFGIDVVDDMQTAEIALDNVTFDPNKPEVEASRK
jgi:nitrate/nitrite transport system substrate-binding protein